MPIQTPSLRFDRDPLALVVEVIHSVQSITVWANLVEAGVETPAVQEEIFSPFEPTANAKAVSLSKATLDGFTFRAGHYIGHALAASQDGMSDEASVEFDLTQTEVDKLNGVTEAVLVPEKETIRITPPPQREVPTITIPPAPTNPNPQPIRIPPAPEKAAPPQPKPEATKTAPATGLEEALREIRQGFGTLTTSVSALGAKVAESTTVTATALRGIATSAAESATASKQAAEAGKLSAESMSEAARASKNAAQAFAAVHQAMQETNTRLGSVESALGQPASRPANQTSENNQNERRMNETNNEKLGTRIFKWGLILLGVGLLCWLGWWMYHRDRMPKATSAEQRAAEAAPSVAPAAPTNSPSTGVMRFAPDSSVDDVKNAALQVFRSMLAEEAAILDSYKALTNQATMQRRSLSTIAVAEASSSSSNSSAVAVAQTAPAQTAPIASSAPIEKSSPRNVRQDIRLEHTTMGNGNVVGVVGDVFNINAAPDKEVDTVYYTNGWPSDWQASSSTTIPNPAIPAQTAIEAPLVPDKVTEYVVASGYGVQPLGDPIPGLQILVGDDRGYRCYDPKVNVHPWFMHGNMRIRMKYSGSGSMNYRFMVVPHGGPVGGNHGGGYHH